MVRKDIFSHWINLYNSKITTIFRYELCDFIGITRTNQISYNNFLQPLKDAEIIHIIDWTNNTKQILIDRKKLEKFIRNQLNYKEVEEFIKISTPFWYNTGMK